MKRAIYNLILLGVITVSITRYVFRLQRERNDWEQRYRDCQASMWMRDPTWLDSSTNLPAK